MDLETGKQIFLGFKNLIFKDEKVESLAEERLKICYTCEFRNETRCGKCGCFLKAKARSTGECPIQKW